MFRGGDVLLASHTGSGKTLAYLLPLVRGACALSNKLPSLLTSQHTLHQGLEAHGGTSAIHGLWLLTASVRLSGNAVVPALPGAHAEAGRGVRRRCGAPQATARHRAGPDPRAHRPDPASCQVAQPSCKVQVPPPPPPRGSVRAQPPADLLWGSVRPLGVWSEVLFHLSIQSLIGPSCLSSGVPARIRPPAIDGAVGRLAARF
jgi:hypothetical protein